MTNTRNHSDENLMQGIQNGSKAAWMTLYERHHQSAYAFIKRILHPDSARAEDILHDVFITVLDSAGTFQKGRAFKPWFYTIAYRKSIKAIQLKPAEDVTYSDQAYEQRMEKIDAASFKRALSLELEKLSEQHRTVFTLRYEMEMSLKDIAEIMDTPEGTVKSRLYYAARSLAKKLNHFKDIYQT